MTPEFSSALEGILRRIDRHPIRKNPAAAPEVGEPRGPLERRRQWFSKLATITIMPLFDGVAEAARKHGANATSRLAEVDGNLAAELEIVRGRLPRGARPPRLTVYPTEGEPPLMIEHTGTFPHIGATGCFGAEVEYDAIHPTQLEEKVLDFVELACGAGSPLS
jgi:hypothetical protein